MPDARATGRVQAAFAATLVDEWARAGVGDAVVSPGSRSTPLALALADDLRIRVHVVLDERSAGFFALGSGLATARPAVVVTTSGTAAAGLHPAVIEAHHARVPLLACTADRPPELHHVGAPQTVEQATLFAGAVRWAFEPGVPDAAGSRWWRSLASRAVAEAVANPAGPGPVHLNLAFREPLVGDPGDLPPARAGGLPWHEVARRPPPWGGDPTVDAELGGGRRGVVVAGAGAGDRAAVADLAARLGWPVLADPRSGCRGVPGSVAAFDPVLRHAGFAEHHCPEVVVRLGQPPASRVLAQWVAGSGAHQVVVDPHGAWADPDRTAALVVAADPTAFCRSVAADGRPAPEEWRAAWDQAEDAAQAAIEEVLAAHAEPTEPGVARVVTRSLPPGATLFASSSMPVRDVEWCGDPGADRAVVSNRGANGIDGIVSTALGLAAADPTRPVVALVGDLAFLHDAGGLLWASEREAACTFVVVDNDGGGIFSFLPQATALSRPTFEKLLGTPHRLDLARLAAVHGIPVRAVASASDVAGAVAEAVAAGGVGVVHVRTDRAANVEVHAEVNRAVAAALDRLWPPDVLPEVEG